MRISPVLSRLFLKTSIVVVYYSTLSLINPALCQVQNDSKPGSIKIDHDRTKQLQIYFQRLTAQRDRPARKEKDRRRNAGVVSSIGLAKRNLFGLDAEHLVHSGCHLVSCVDK